MTESTQTTPSAVEVDMKATSVSPITSQIDKAKEMIEKASISETELRLSKKEEELKALELQLDKKVQTLQKLMDEAMQAGRSKMIVPVVKSKDEIIRDRVNAMLAPMGRKI